MIFNVNFLPLLVYIYGIPRHHSLNAFLLIFRMVNHVLLLHVAL